MESAAKLSTSPLEQSPLGVACVSALFWWRVLSMEPCDVWVRSVQSGGQTLRAIEPRQWHLNDFFDETVAGQLLQLLQVALHTLDPCRPWSKVKLLTTLPPVGEAFPSPEASHRVVVQAVCSSSAGFLKPHLHRCPTRKLWRNQSAQHAVCKVDSPKLEAPHLSGLMVLYIVYNLLASQTFQASRHL